MTVPVLDFWFEFASTYSYLAAMRVGVLAETADVAVRFRPFLLGPILKAQGWDTSPFNLFPAKGRHMWRDLERTCAEHKLAFRRPTPFPQSSVLAARVALVGLDQSLDASLSESIRPWGNDFCRGVFRAEFADGMRIDAPETIRLILSDLNVDAEAAIARANRRHQRPAQIANGAGAGARHFRRADLHHRGRRIVLGKRPDGKRHRLGQAHRLNPSETT
jgi:2-hydroxychromene-2-carboxylate isomerase